MKEQEQLVVFLCKEKEWESYRDCNPGFSTASSGKVAWLSHEDAANRRAFMVMKWEDNARQDTRDRFLKGEQPRDMTGLPWCRHLNKVILSGKDSVRVVVFVHWGDTENLQKLKMASEKLQSYLHTRQEFRAWRIYALSSHDMDVNVSPFGRVFDVGEPVVPVSNFDAWFKMYEKWWEKGRDAVETAYSPPTAFPSHKDGRVPLSASNSTKPRGDDNVNAASGENKASAGNNGKGADKTVEDTANPLCDSSKRKNVWAAVMAIPVGIMMVLASFFPMWLVFRCLDAMAFQAKTTRGTISMLLVALLAAAFSEVILGWLVATILSRRNREAKD